jgi:adenylate kinase family enzyme
VVFVDFPRWVCLVRAMKRLAKWSGRTRPDMGQGCPEAFNWEFLKWIWRYPREERPVLLQQIREHGRHLEIVSMGSQREVDRFLRSLELGVPLKKTSLRILSA